MISSLKFDFTKLKPTQIPMLMSFLNNPYTLTLREEKGSKLTTEELDNNFRYFLNNLISGTATQIPYFDNEGNLTSDDGFSRTTETTSISNPFWTPDYLQFTGSGENDALLIPVNGYYTGPTNSVYTITISATGPSADFIDWTSTSGASGSNVEIVSGDLTPLDDEIGVYFKNPDGHTLGDVWEGGLIQILSFFSNGDVLSNGGIANATLDVKNSIISIYLLGNATGRPNGSFFGLINNNTGGQGSINITSDDGQLFSVDIYAGDGNVGSQLTMDEYINFQFSTGDSYTFPTNNAQGPLVNDGSGSLSFQTGFSGTYSTGEGQIVTVTNGIITSVS
jgi:hypothetical protein